MQRHVDAHSRCNGVNCAQKGHISAALATHQASRKPVCDVPTPQGSNRSRRTPGAGSCKAVSTDNGQEVKLQDLRSTSWEPAQTQEKQQKLQVREARHAEEFREVGWLRARAYFENKAPVRYQGSFTKQFAEQEARSLVGRTQPSKSCPVPEAVCLIAMRPESKDQAVHSGDIMATADIKPPASAGGNHPQEIPQDNTCGNEGAYIQNVVVCTRFRRKGCGKAIMTSAEEYARRLWGAKRVYVQVSSGNEPAQQLYLKLGYETHSLLSRGLMLLYKDV